MLEQSKSLLEAIRKYVSECHLLKGNVLHIDQTDAKFISYSIQTSGLVKLSEDVIGNQTWQYNAILQSRECTADDMSRLSASNFTEHFVFYIDECNRIDLYPDLPDGMTPTQIYADNGMLLIIDDDGDSGIYQAQIHLLFKKEAEEDF